MKRPSFQFYPADWLANIKLRRCTEAARGVWVDVLCLLHDSDEYGVLRWPLADIARAAGVPLKPLHELAAKTVMKGSDGHCAPYIYVPRHAGKDGQPVTLIAENDGPCWYSSRFVRDEYVRTKRGIGSRFGEDPSQNQSPPLVPPPKPPFGDGPTASSSASSSRALKPAFDLALEKTPLAVDNSLNGHSIPDKSGEGKGRKPAANWSSVAWVNATAQTLGMPRIPGESDELFADRVHTAATARLRA